MIKRFFSWEQKFTISKAAIIVGFFTLLSRLIGLVRDRLFASHFGAGDTLDVYYAAFRIPDFVFNLLILGTLSVAFIPIFTELLLKDKKRAYENANSVLNISFLAISFLSIILIFLARPLTHILVPGFTGAKFDETVTLTRIFLLSPIIFTLSNVFSSILNAQKKFIVTGIAPLLYNAGIIFGLLYLYPAWGLKGLGFGVIIGALMHLLVQIPEAIRYGYRWKPFANFRDEAFVRMAKLFVPRIFGVDNSQISLLIGSVVGSVLASGSVAVFNLANNLQAVPLGIFAISIAIAAFPVLSEEFAAGNETSFAKTLASSIIEILFFIIPITICILLLRAHLVRLAFGAGKFSWQDTILTFNTLGIFALSLFSQALAPLFSRAFYARHNTVTPVIINLFGMALNGVLAYILGRAYGVVGVAAGFSIASVFNTLILFLFLRMHLAKKPESKQLLPEFDRELIAKIFKISIASMGLGVVCYATLHLAALFLNTHTFIGLLVQAGTASIAGLVVFFALCYALKLQNAKDLLQGIREKLHLSRFF